MLSEKNKIVLDQHFVELTNKFPDFIKKECDNQVVIRGKLPFRAIYNNETIEDEYEIKIIIPDDYPESIPTVNEISGRIPDDFHRNKFIDDSLCLGAPRAIAKKFKKSPTLLYFVEQQVVPFFYSYSYFQKYGKMPYGDLPHGGEGILEYYKSYFGISDDIAITGLLRILADNDYRGHILCPCGSQNKLRKCHGKLLIELIDISLTKACLYEYMQVLDYLFKSKKKIPKEYLSKTIEKEIKKIKNGKK